MAPKTFPERSTPRTEYSVLCAKSGKKLWNVGFFVKFFRVEHWFFSACHFFACKRATFYVAYSGILLNVISTLRNISKRAPYSFLVLHQCSFSCAALTHQCSDILLIVTSILRYNYLEKSPVIFPYFYTNAVLVVQLWLINAVTYFIPKYPAVRFSPKYMETATLFCPDHVTSWKKKTILENKNRVCHFIGVPELYN